MSIKVNILLITASLMGFAGSAVYSQDEKSAAESQKAEALDQFEKSLDSKIMVINKKLAQYSSLMNEKVTHTPVHSRFRKGDGYIEYEKYDFIYENPSSSVIVGGRKKLVKLYYNGDTLSKVESEIIDENYVLRTKKTLKVTDPSPATEENTDMTVFRQLNKESPREFKLADMQNTISNPNRIQFKKEFYLDFINNLEEDLRYTRKYVDLYGTNSQTDTIEELKTSIDY